MKILKTAVGTLTTVGGAMIFLIGGSLEYVCCAIGANAPEQSFSEWEESQKSLDNLDFGHMHLVKLGEKIVDKGIDTIRDAVR